jgi:hypothetical protein
MSGDKELGVPTLRQRTDQPTKSAALRRMKKRLGFINQNHGIRLNQKKQSKTEEAAHPVTLLSQDREGRFGGRVLSRRPVEQGNLRIRSS